MSGKMDESMKKELDAVLDRVKEPESGLSLSEIGLVQKFRYLPHKKTLYVYRNPIHPTKGCCTLISNMLLETVQKNLLAELRAAFPGLRIELVVPTFVANSGTA